MEKRQKVHLKQFKEQGWCDSDTWSLDFAFVKFIYPRLKRFRELTFSHPAYMTDTEWKKILDEMIEGFEIASDEKRYFCAKKEDDEKIQKAFDLFSKYARGLWW